MKSGRVIIVCTLLFSILCSCNKPYIKFETNSFLLYLDVSGNVISLTDKSKGKDYYAGQEKSPLLSIRINGEYESPSSIVWDEDSKQIFLKYSPSQSAISVRTKQNTEYITFEITEVRSGKDIELVVWGPFATTISQTVGECVGVVRNSEYAIGIQALNAKTIGGYPVTEDDVDPNFNVQTTTSLADAPDSLGVHYRGQTAKHTSFGSVLQAYCRNRNKERIIPMWGHTHYTAPAYDDGGILGSKIALFGCPEARVLDYIEKIELGEGLPHPELNGVWMKRAPEAAQAYIIYPFNENNIEEAVAFTKQTGLKYLYHGGPFRTWGKFELNSSEFPTGIEGLKNCVDKARREGIKLGVHTLSNFITTNDPYVTPVPDKRLAKVGSSVLSSGIDAVQTEIEIADPVFFNQMGNNHLHSIMIGDELIRYEGVSESAPWKLLNCQRGAWGTKAAAYPKGTEISKLFDHGYKVFLSDTELTKEIARNLAGLFNQTGLEQISFDGLEGAWSTGLGQYGLSLMVEEWYNHLKPEYRNTINDASMTTHYNWHTFTRMNWGEPWYAGFRESQMDLRLMNQDFYRRNLIPGMLGWFKLDANTNLEDIEWLLARSAAFDAGYALVTDSRNVNANGMSGEIIKAIREWERARLSGAFPEELKREMEYISNEYTLSQKSNNTWSLYSYHIQRFKHTNVILQPGEPVVSKWTFDNINERQPIQFILKSNDRISDISLEIGNFSTVEISGILEPGDYMKYTGGDEIIVYDRNWNTRHKVAVNKNQMIINSGESQLIFSCTFADTGNTEKYLSGEFKTISKETELKATR